MAVAVALCAGQAHALANADVVIFVAEIGIRVVAARGKSEGARDAVGARQRRQRADIGEISGRKQNRVALAVYAGELAFDLIVKREIAAEQP